MDFNEARTKYQSRMNVLIEQSRSKKIEKNILFTELVRIGDIFELYSKVVDWLKLYK